MTLDHLTLATLGAMVLGVALAMTSLSRLLVIARTPGSRAPVSVLLGLFGSVALAAVSAAVLTALVLDVGGSRPPPLAAPVATRSRPAPPPAAAGGATITADPHGLDDGQEISWPLVQMRLRVPRGWTAHVRSATELELRDPNAPDTVVGARAQPVPAGPSADDYVRADLDRARDRLAQGAVAGYATRTIGGVPGVVVLERRADAATVSWSGYEPAETGSVAITVTAASAGRDAESLLGAIVGSIRFE